MRLENQVTSLELSKRLKELGVEQDSYFYWCNFYSEKYSLFHPVTTNGDMAGPSDIWLVENLLGTERAYSAFTASELGEMLPNGFEDYKTDRAWSCVACDITQISDNAYEQDINETNMRAKMLIHLIENKII